MINKLLGGAIIIGVIGGLIFAIKFIPAYVGYSDLESSFQECIANFEQYKEAGCRSNFAGVIKENDIKIDAEQIFIDCQVQMDCVIEAQYVQTMDFFGFYKYEYKFHPLRKGRAPKRT